MFAQNLKLLRTLLGLTQAELGAQIGVSRRVISYYENGEGEPRADLLRRICETYDISADKMIGRRSLADFFGDPKDDPYRTPPPWALDPALLDVSDFSDGEED